MADVDKVSDAELLKKLKEFGYPSVPVTDSTRVVLKKKLKEFLSKPVQKKKKSLASFSSGEDEEESHEEVKGKRGSASMLPPPQYNSPRSSKRKTLGPTVIVPQSTTPMSTSQRKTTRASLGAAPDPGSPSYTGTPRPKGMPSAVLRPRKYDPYDTGSDNDDEGDTRTQQSNKHQESSKNKHNESGPFRSQFGRRLGESSLRSSLTPSSHNGHFTAQSINSPPRVTTQKEPTSVQRTHSATTQQTEEHAWFNSSLVSKLLIGVFVVFFAYITYRYMGIRTPDYAPQMLAGFESNPENKFPLCKDGQMPAVNCVIPGEARTAMVALKSLVPQLTQDAIKAACDGNEQEHISTTLPPGAMNFRTIENLLELSGDPDTENTVANILILARHNPHWGITVLENGLVIADPPLPFMCWLRIKAVVLFSTSIVFFLVILAVCAVYYAYCAYKDKIKLQERQMIELANRIIDCLTAKHYIEEASGLNSASVTPVYLIRDELLPPSYRKRLGSVWELAVKYATDTENSLRLEIRRINGEEVEVFVWLPVKFPPTPSASSVASSNLHASNSPDVCPSASSQGSDTPTRRLRVWQGQAFETMEGSVNSLPYSPTPCLKIRHMFDPDVAQRQGQHAEEDEAWPERIKDAILEKCGDGVNILHVSVDKHSNEGCVFVKCASQADAGRAYRALHGSWYDGNLVTVKYLRVERYHERFPDSTDSCIPLRPSNNQKLSLQAHCWQSALERT